MKHILHLLPAALLMAASTVVSAKSLVLRLSDTRGTLVYYKLPASTTDTEVLPSELVFEEDGTFSVNGDSYKLTGIKNFFISQTDFSGEKYTREGSANTTGIEAPSMTIEGGKLLFSGDSSKLRVYNVGGQLVKVGRTKAGDAGQAVGGLDLSTLRPGTYVVTDGQTTLKIQKR